MKATTLLVLIVIFVALVAAKWTWIEESDLNEEDFEEGEEATTLQNVKEDARGCLTTPGNWVTSFYRQCRYPDGFVKLPDTCDCERCPMRVEFFEHCNYEGKSWPINVLGENSYVGDEWNDKISSVKVYPGTKVTLYQHDKFNGDNIVLIGDVACLVEHGWNDAVSSYKIEKYNP